MPTPETLMEAIRYYADPDVCHAMMIKAKWPNGKITCPECEGRKIGEIKSRRMLQCKECRKQFSAKVGTIFEDSPLPLDKWFVAVWCVANCKNGISSYELGRAIGVTQKTAWFMLQRIRLAMETETFQMDGPAEADTTYVGGKAEYMHAKRRAKAIPGRGSAGKTPVHGVLKRSSKDKPSQIQANVMGRESSVALLKDVRQRVRYGAAVYTDEAPAYGPLCMTHVHQAVDHSKGYVAGSVHCNGVENFWSLLKRSIKGTYVAVAPYHLQRYVAEQAFRFNNRKMGDGGRFETVMSGIAGKRLTYRVLCAIGDAGFMGIQ